MIFPQQIAAEICDRYHLTGNTIYFLNMNAIFEIGIFYALEIVFTLNFQMFKIQF